MQSTFILYPPGYISMSDAVPGFLMLPLPLKLFQIPSQTPLAAPLPSCRLTWPNGDLWLRAGFPTLSFHFFIHHKTLQLNKNHGFCISDVRGDPPPYTDPFWKVAKHLYSKSKHNNTVRQELWAMGCLQHLFAEERLNTVWWQLRISPQHSPKGLLEWRKGALGLCRGILHPKSPTSHFT